MPIRALRNALLAFATFALVSSLQASSADATESCRHLGVIEIKIADEHCGYLDSERKLAVQDVACSLADQQKQALQKEAREGSSTCRTTECEGSLRQWQNTYTHVFSQNCWTECGWAWVIDCESSPRQDPDAEAEPSEEGDVESGG